MKMVVTFQVVLMIIINGRNCKFEGKRNMKVLYELLHVCYNITLVAHQQRQKCKRKKCSSIEEKQNKNKQMDIRSHKDE